MTDREPPAGYEPAATEHVHFYLDEQVDYDGSIPLFMVMRSGKGYERILAERCLRTDGMYIVDALRLQYSITNWGTT